MVALDDKVLIIGAGIGGLTLAHALRARGFECEVFERQPELAPVGAGISVQTSAMLALRTLGLDEEVAREGEELRVGHGRTARGGTLLRTSLAFLREEFGVPSVAIHRARLHRVLRAGVEITVERELVLFREDPDGVNAVFGNARRARGALLVGADGLHSMVRRELLGETPLRYAGYTSWRGIAETRAAVREHEAVEMWGRGARFGYVGIGHGEVYWFAVANAPEGGRDEDPLGVVAARFGRWAQPVSQLLAATPPERVLRTDIHDREPVPRWSGKRVTLLGDAAHPTTPNLGQGGCMAIEDAVVLAHALERGPTIEAALADYEARRVERTARVVAASRSFGRLAQLENPVAIALRNVALRLTPSSVARERLRESAEFSLETGLARRLARRGRRKQR